MRKIINDPDDFVDEVVDGILAAHPLRRKAVTKYRRALARAYAPIAGHVGIVTGGGQVTHPVPRLRRKRSWHGPRRSRSATCSRRRQPEQILEATRAANGGAGVRTCMAITAANVMKLRHAGEFARMRASRLHLRWHRRRRIGSPIPRSRSSRRRGSLLRVQVRGAAAEIGRPLTEWRRQRRRRSRTRRARWASDCRRRSCRPPGSRRSSSAPTRWRSRIGIHGERGVRRGRLETADRTRKICWGRSATTSRLRVAMTSPCSSTVSARRRLRSCTSLSLRSRQPRGEGCPDTSAVRR